ncbi:MAG TPA: type I-MYXAN CRISPR-associated endonuclease Cas1 [Kofleriaceae bacterium]|nr:type I-MYXAN CRISPR-associated endonuclease Cas1 [Kofleriaceae bacterium]
MDEQLINVGALHALIYCERLFYLEEVERIRVADAAVFAGRRLHQEIALAEDELGVEYQSFASEDLGVRGSVDVLRRRSGELIPYEHKRGRAAGKKAAREAWATDRVQVGAYALLVEDAYRQRVEEGRVRYHADAVTVRVPIDDALRAEVAAAIERARALRRSVERPPVTPNERLCVRCSLAPVCLPEEARLGADPEFTPIRLLPPHPDGQTIHVLEHGATVGRSGEELKVRIRDGGETRVPSAEVGQLVLHGFAQITTQALRLCAEREIGVHWMTMGGGVIGSFAPGAAPGQRHLRQFAALTDAVRVVALARRLVVAKLEAQLRYLLRATRHEGGRGPEVEVAVRQLRTALHGASKADTLAALLGHEGGGAAAYFSVLCELIDPDLREHFVLDGRSRRPPRDRVNALLSYGYGMLYREVLTAIIAVGLHPGVGFYHQPRSSAHTLALDLMELFRVPLIDMAMIGAINRRTFDPLADFRFAPGQVLLSDTGRRKAIEVIERRKADEWRHSVVGYSLSYARLIELEVRLLEKEWMGEGGLFAKFRLR